MAKRGKIPTPKTQREILNSQIDPYSPPAGSPGFSDTGNPNNADVPNRGNHIFSILMYNTIKRDSFWQET